MKVKYAVCYDTLYVFKNVVELKKFFLKGYYSSEGAEQERYASILVAADFDEIVKDNVSEICNEISIKKEDKCVQVHLKEDMNPTKALYYFKNTIKPILEVCDDYGIDFNMRIPFEDFGNDDESTYGRMISISTFYNNLLQKFDIEVDNIETRDRSDGKYIITINNNKEFDMSAGDDLENVIDNVESMIEELAKEDIEISM